MVERFEYIESWSIYETQDWSRMKCGSFAHAIGRKQYGILCAPRCGDSFSALSIVGNDYIALNFPVP